VINNGSSIEFVGGTKSKDLRSSRLEVNDSQLKKEAGNSIIGCGSVTLKARTETAGDSMLGMTNPVFNG
jgi:hypothetical protein